MKAVFICSLSYSGSTLLDLMLSAHPRVCGVGEIDQMLDPENRKRHLDKTGEVLCTCGASMDNCPVWGPYTQFIRSLKSEDFVSKYRRMMELVAAEAGGDAVLVDSSKYELPLRRLLDSRQALGLDPADLTVIHLLKDVRGFVMSQKRSKNLGPMGELRFFREWYQFNSSMERLIADSGVSRVTVGYEELCLYPEATMRRICEAIGIPYDEAMLNPGNARSHLALGNMMRLDAKKSKRLYYDNRWFIDDAIQWKYMLLFWIRRYNRHTVYRHSLDPQKGARFQPR